MKESSFEHKFSIGQKVKYPDNNRLEKGSIDEVRFHKKERRGTGKVEYLVVPRNKSKKQGTIRSQDNLVSD